LPASHATQSATDELFVFALNLPRAHSEHSETPPEVAYVPTAQGTHSPALWADVKYPGEHAEQTDAPVVLKVPAAHATHAVGESALEPPLAVPAGHSEHTLEPVASA
jgi:hypothetical protein